MKIGSLFSGIGGLELGLESAGLGRVIWQVEVDPFCSKVLEKHWPGVRRYGDITGIASNYLEKPDVICGGFPCQDVSQAACKDRRKGLKGHKSGLWWEYHRIIKDIQPKIVIIENVASGKQRWLPEVVSSVEDLGYRARAFQISAEDVGAPHGRKRIFVVAHSNTHGQPTFSEHGEVAGMPDRAREVRSRWLAEPSTLRMAHGIPAQVDRLRALGNAVVPQCAKVIGRMIIEGVA